MVHKLILYSLLMVFIFTSSPACADTSPYIGVTFGSPITSVNKLSISSGSYNTDFDPGYMAGLTAGAEYDAYMGWNVERIRGEVEIGHRSSKMIKIKKASDPQENTNSAVDVTTIMINGYIESTSVLTSDLPINVYFTAGIGGAIATISSVYYQNALLIKSARDKQLAYQGGMGAGYELTKNTTVDATYKYLTTTTLNFAGVKAEYGSHNVLLGLRYLFK